MRKKVLAVSFFYLAFFLLTPQAFADETGFRFPATCTTNGSSCDNMQTQDNAYNSFNFPYKGYIISKLDDFGIPENALIDEIQIKLRIRSLDTNPWFAFVQTNTRVYYSYGTCTENIYGFYIPTASFNTITAPTLCWHPDPTDPQAVLYGKELRDPAFQFWINHNGFTPSTDIDTMLINVKYHLPPTSHPLPFLNLPWNYEIKNMSFDDAALAINSFFDHSYPLLSTGLYEPPDVAQQLTTFENRHTQLSYSSHDGYDYGLPANVRSGDPVLAAAAGWASYINSCQPCGNMITIDHLNGYRTRYLHLQSEGLITTIPGQKLWVNDRQVIGKVGATGNVIPSGNAGAHIHFDVYQNDLPTDPFGWQSTDADPWENYSFFYNSQLRTGNKSYYLWKNRLASLIQAIGIEGGTLKIGHFTADFPADSVPAPITIKMQSAPNVRTTINGKQYISLGPVLNAAAHDIFGNIFEAFRSAFSLIVDMGSLNLGLIKPGTLSLYSSNDGITWNKETTTIDMTNKKATTSINHFSYFTLMGEAIDDTPPATHGHIESSASTSAVWIAASPSTGTVTVGAPFNVDVKVEDGGEAFNAVRANVAVSSNLSIAGLHMSPSNSCNLYYLQNPTVSNPSFAGAIFGSSSTGCNVYTLTLTPISAGEGTISFNNASIKSYADASEIVTGVQNASFTINESLITLPELTITSPVQTYLSSFHLFGTKDPAVTHVFINDSETGSTYPTTTTWDNTVNLSVGENIFTLYGKDDNNNQTSPLQTTVNRHFLGDINGDGEVDLTDASLFTVDWDKTENLTYILSDMNNDRVVDLTDLSILARLE